MRNPVIQATYAKKICTFNFNPLSNKNVNEVNPYSEKNLFIKEVIECQGPALLAKIDLLKKRLSSSKHPEHVKNLEITEKLQKTFLFEGYQEYFLGLIPKGEYSSLDISRGTAPAQIPETNPFPSVLCHNDIHQNNILMGLNDNLDLMLIDNEYAGWNPMAMDLAVYINEVMIDNSHPHDNGVKEYMDNKMSKDE